MPQQESDPEYPETHHGLRKDGRNLINEWLKSKHDKYQQAEYVWNQDQFDKIKPEETENLIGMFLLSINVS